MYRIDIEENSPFQEAIISETYVQEPYELKDLIDTTKLIQKFYQRKWTLTKF